MTISTLLEEAYTNSSTSITDNLGLGDLRYGGLHPKGAFYTDVFGVKYITEDNQDEMGDNYVDL